MQLISLHYETARLPTAVHTCCLQQFSIISSMHTSFGLGAVSCFFTLLPVTFYLPPTIDFLLTLLNTIFKSLAKQIVGLYCQCSRICSSNNSVSITDYELKNRSFYCSSLRVYVLVQTFLERFNWVHCKITQRIPLALNDLHQSLTSVLVRTM